MYTSFADPMAQVLSPEKRGDRIHRQLLRFDHFAFADHFAFPLMYAAFVLMCTVTLGINGGRGVHLLLFGAVSGAKLAMLSDADLDKIHDELDKDKDGYITPRDGANVMQNSKNPFLVSLFEDLKKLPRGKGLGTELSMMFKDADWDQDQKISKKEFRDLISDVWKTIDTNIYKTKNKGKEL